LKQCGGMKCNLTKTITLPSAPRSASAMGLSAAGSARRAAHARRRLRTKQPTAQVRAQEPPVPLLTEDLYQNRHRLEAEQ
jgi:hypothetical protein